MSSIRDETEICALIDDLVEGLRAKDPGRVLYHYAPEKVQFLLAPPLKFAGPNAIDTKSLSEWFSSFQGPLEYEISELSVTAGDDVAFCHSLNRMGGTKIDGEQVNTWIRWTACFRKLNGLWKITHDHESVPFYMDGSYKAAIDLKP